MTEKRDCRWTKVENAPGLYERNDGGGYYVDFTIKGRRYSKAAGTDLETALTILYDMQSRARLGTCGLLTNDFKLEELHRLFMLKCKQQIRPATVKSYRYNFERLWEFFQKGRLVSNLRPSQTTEYTEHRREAGVSDSTIRRELSVFRAMLRFGVRQQLIASNPLEHADLPKAPQTISKRALGFDEFQLLVDHRHRRPRPHGLAKTTRPCNSCDLWLVLGLTGLRTGELVHLTWGDVDFALFDGKGGILVQPHQPPRYDHEWAPKTKASKRIVPMVPPVRKVFEKRFAQRESEKERVFLTQNRTPIRHNLRRKFLSCLKAAEIDPEGLSPHSFRHTFCSFLHSVGVPQRVVQRLAGHSSYYVTMETYTHALRSDVDSATERFGAKLVALGLQLPGAADSHASPTHADNGDSSAA